MLRIWGGDHKKYVINSGKAVQRILFLALLPLLHLIALLPFPLLYLFSDGLFLLIYYGVGYRKKLVRQNLSLTFPEKNVKEITVLSKKFYSFFCDNMLEMLKMSKMSASEMKKRAWFHDQVLFHQLFEKRQSFILMLGHNGNWEWGSAAFELHSPFHILCIYKPLSNPLFDRLVCQWRTRFGQEVTTMKNTLRNMIRLKDRLTATAFIADQRPELTEHAYWDTFLERETDFLQGTEKIAQKLNYPVVFAEVIRKKRGYYEIFLEILCENPATSKEGEITFKFVRRLEKQIRANPELWLWSHNRWKHQKKTQTETV